MQKLASTIAKELKSADHYAVYQPELDRVWPRNGKRRQALIEKFAKEHSWRVRHYKDGFVVIFDKEPPSKRN